MTNQKPSPGNWLFTVPLLAGAIAYFVFVFLPFHRSNNELRSEIRDKRTYLTQAKSVGAALVAGEQQIQAATRFRDQWLARTPKASHVADLFAQIQQVEMQSGVHANRFDPQPIEPQKWITEIPLQLSCVGDYRQVHSLIYGLETLPVDIWIRNLQLEKKSATSENIECNLDLVVFADNPEKSDYIKKSD